jgi:hypothetical protein
MDDASSDAPAKKKTKKSKSKGSQSSAVAELAAAAGTAQSGENFLYHPEDEIITSIVGKEMVCEYAFSNAPKRGEMGDGMDFGVDMRGRIALMDIGKLEKLVEEAEIAFSA